MKTLREMVEARKSEHDHQRDFVRWFRARHGPLSCYSVPNEGKRNHKTANWLKSAGRLSGAPDVHLVPHGRVPNFTGSRYAMAPVVVEMKRPDERKKKNGGVSDEQRAVHTVMRAAGWIVIVAYGFDDARAQVLDLGL